MAKFTLETPTTFDYLVIGIASHEPIYKLCWSINKLFDLSLTLKNNTNSNAYHCFWEIYKTEAYLYQNKQEGHILLPEVPHADYLFVIQDHTLPFKKGIIKSLKGNNQVLAVFDIDTKALKSTSNLEL